MPLQPLHGHPAEHAWPAAAGPWLFIACRGGLSTSSIQGAACGLCQKHHEGSSIPATSSSALVGVPGVPKSPGRPPKTGRPQRRAWSPRHERWLREASPANGADEPTYSLIRIRILDVYRYLTMSCGLDLI
ncbi:hypothetical protein GQ53DRAFT_96444 [Thozetella sp. PMI_491]|nr:hypothetical protein GQ53DRAFT_96444 [Thozetella sp. PMI_491]